jgi:hypothetical protein
MQENKNFYLNYKLCLMVLSELFNELFNVEFVMGGFVEPIAKKDDWSRFIRQAFL